MRVFCGPFHRLEAGLLDDIASLKKSNPLSGAAVVVPSRRMADRLQAAYARGRGPAAGLVFHTFVSLAAELSADSSSPAVPLAFDSGLDRFLVGELAASSAQESPFGSADRKNLAMALRSTLRDMLDAQVDTATVREHIADPDFIFPDDAQRLRWLLDLQDNYSAAVRNLPFEPMREMFLRAARAAESTPALTRYERVYFYGFYDLTGIQLELFRSVCGAADSAVFFPYRRHAAYSFAGKFFETNVAGLSSETVYMDCDDLSRAAGPALDALFCPEKPPVPVAPEHLQVVSVSGSRDELWAAAKEILPLLAAGYAPDDIGVVARTLEPYAADIDAVFSENGIPYVCETDQPLLSFPLAKFCSALLFLERGGYEKDDLLDILSSPYFSGSPQWRGLLAKCGGAAGLEQWRALLARQEGGDKGLGAWLSATAVVLRGLKKPPSWKEGAECARAFLKEHFLTAGLTAQEEELRREVFDGIAALASYDLVRPPLEDEFLDELAERLASAAVSVPSAKGGVAVMDAMAARGRGFRVLIMLGLNEKLFPRLIREDPVLRDRHRRFMRDTEGFWLWPKLEGYDEEKLLFHLLASSASEKLVCVYQRSDSGGRALVPSIYLAELCRSCGRAQDGNLLYVSRRHAEKLAALDPLLLSESELRLRLAGCADADKYYAACGFEQEGFSELKKSAGAIGFASSAGDFDGFVGGHGLFERVNKRGFSPSAMESLSSCPMRFFLERILHLSPDTEPLSGDSLARNHVGTIYHEIFQRAYKKAYGGQKPCSLEAAVQDISAEMFSAENGKNYGLYPVLWEALGEEMSLFALTLAKEDFAAMGGWKPSYFEQPLGGRIDGVEDISWRGIADRIDVEETQKIFRVIDYKSKRKKTGKTLEPLVRKGELLQPYVYARLAQHLLEKQGLSFDETLFMEVEHDAEKNPLRSQSFSAAEAAETAEAVNTFISFLAGLVREGTFPIRPDDSEHGRCAWCLFGGICRKNHAAARRRAAHCAQTLKREELANAGN